MFRTTILSGCLAAGMLATGSGAHAQAPVVPPAQSSTAEQQRIDSGAATGTLTPHEAASLQQRQNSINRQRKLAHRTGTGETAAERAAIKRRQAKLNAAIHEQKTDGQVAAPAPLPPR